MGLPYQVTTPGGAVTTTLYHADGDVAQVTDPDGQRTVYGYDGLGRQTTVTYPDGTSTVTGYDAAGNATSVRQLDASGNTLTATSATFDGEGDQLSATDALGNATTFTYDPTGLVSQEVQPVSATSGITTSFGYDGAGNLTRDGSKTFTYDARGELTGDGTDTYTYTDTARGTPSSESSPAGTVQVTFDAYGDQATAGTRSYAYDALGRLTADVAAAGTGYTFSYAGATDAIASDGTSTYTWDPSGSVLAGIGTAGGTAPGVLAFADAHGDVLGQFTAAGTAMAGSRAYDPWGSVTAAAAGTMAGGLGFQGAWADPGTGKDLMGARRYDPQAGDFTSADTVQVSPVPDPAAAAPYAYAGDDPLDAADPTGHCTWLGTEVGVAAACMPQVASGTASGQATISPRAYGSGQGLSAGWGLNTGSFAGGSSRSRTKPAAGAWPRCRS